MKEGRGVAAFGIRHSAFVVGERGAQERASPRYGVTKTGRRNDLD